MGIVLGCQPKSNHLWYHLFAPEELKDTYMTGFMVNKTQCVSLPDLLLVLWFILFINSMGSMMLRSALIVFSMTVVLS